MATLNKFGVPIDGATGRGGILQPKLKYRFRVRFTGFGNLGANPISALPETLSTCNNLEFLGLARTQISRLPDWIFSSPSLRELDISYIEDRIPRAQIELLCAQNISLVTRPGLVVL